MKWGPLFLYLLLISGCAQVPSIPFIGQKVEIESLQVETFPELKRYEDVIMGLVDGPESDFNELANLGVKTVIDVRVVGEQGFLPEDQETEKGLVESTGMDYLSYPMGVELFTEQKLTAQKLNQLASLVESKKKEGQVFLQCNSGNRSASWLGWYLHKKKNFSVENALKASEEAGMRKQEYLKALKKILDAG